MFRFDRRDFCCRARIHVFPRLLCRLTGCSANLLLSVCFASIIYLLCNGSVRAESTAHSEKHAHSTQDALRNIPLAYVIDISEMPAEERLTALALQGLANRDRPKVMLQAEETVRWNRMDYDFSEPGAARWWNPKITERMAKTYPNIAAYWIAYCEQLGIVRFQASTLAEAIQDLTSDFKGVILFENLEDDLAVAATMSGIESALPMTERLYRKINEEIGRELPVVFDIRQLYKDYDPKAERRIEAHRWALRHLLPKCDKSAAFSRDKTYNASEHDTLIDVDLAIRNRWLTFDLTFLSKETYEGFIQNKPDSQWGYNPPDADILTEILRSLDQPFPKIYGWGRPDEEIIIRRLAGAGATLICTGTGNTSFLQMLPMPVEKLEQPNPSIHSSHKLERKVYVCFAVNEGDTLKCLASLQNWGGWIQPERGSFPINWGMNPALYDDFAGLVGYFHATATKNDYFFLAPSGWGYLAPDKLSDAQLSAYGDLVRKGVNFSGLDYADIWYMDPGLRQRKQFYPFLSQIGVKGLAQKQIPGFAGKNFNGQWVDFAPDGTPVIYSDMYYDCFFAGSGGVEPAVAKIFKAAEEMGAPWFIYVYGGSPYFFSEIAKKLPSEKFKIVAMPEFFEAAKGARSLIEGRVYNSQDSEVRPQP